jgi:hypothetical protein
VCCIDRLSWQDPSGGGLETSLFPLEWPRSIYTLATSDSWKTLIAFRNFRLVLSEVDLSSRFEVVRGERHDAFIRRYYDNTMKGRAHE